jgi:hypothetical protein
MQEKNTLTEHFHILFFHCSSFKSCLVRVSARFRFKTGSGLVSAKGLGRVRVQRRIKTDRHNNSQIA